MLPENVFSSNTPREGRGSWEAGGIRKGTGVKAPRAGVPVGRLGAPHCARRKAETGTRPGRVGGRDQEGRPAGGTRASAPSPGPSCFLPSCCSPFAVLNCTAAAVRP